MNTDFGGLYRTRCSILAINIRNECDENDGFLTFGQPVSRPQLFVQQ